MTRTLPADAGQRHGWLAFLAALLLAVLAVAPAAAQDMRLAGLSAQLSQAEADLRAVDQAIGRPLDKRQRNLERSKALAAAELTAQATKRLKSEQALVNARVEQLGPVKSGLTEAADIRAARDRLAQEQSAIDSAIKRGRLLGMEARQLADDIERSQAEQFGKALAAKAASPLSPAFWIDTAAAVAGDMRKAIAFLFAGRDPVSAAWASGRIWLPLAGVALGFALWLPGGRLARRLGYRFLVEEAPGWRVRRSGNAVWRMLVDTAAPLLAALVVVQSLRWAGPVAGGWDKLLDALVVGAGYAGFTVAVAGALLMPKYPGWRLAGVGDDAARTLVSSARALALVAFACILLDALNGVIGVAAQTRFAAQAAEALAHIVVIGGALLAISRIRTAASQEGKGALGALTIAAWIAILLAVLTLLAGHIGFSLLAMRMLAWAATIGGAAYLVMTLIDDAAVTALHSGGRVGRTVNPALGLRDTTLDQLGVLLSGGLRVFVAIAALSLMTSPIGAGGGLGDLFDRLGGLARGFEVGGVAVSPGTILRGLIVLLVGLALVRAFMRWLEGRYLPATGLDGSARNSVSLIARYVGIALAAIWALASLGVGIEKIAILLSALSVGIGFGLQAITQNFVSGLILLAERPIKIGDLIRLGSDEGDVKRISVRSTEIELPDHSILIVPNSELITKPVLNKTQSSALGRVQIQFSVPIEADVGDVRQTVIDAFNGEDTILAEPAPAAFVESIGEGRVLFSCYGHVASPRAVYAARSNLFLVILDRLRESGVAVGTVA